MYPRYEIPRKLVFQVAGAVLSGGRRDLHADAAVCVAALGPALRVLGGENIPQVGPALIVMNHYQRPGFKVWWLSLVVSSLLPMQHTWLMSAEWTAPGVWYEPLKSAASRALFRKLAGVYGFLLMPPMPPRPQDVAERASSVRGVLSYVEHVQDPVLCLAPEGRDMPGGVLGRPASGTGRFLSLLAARGLPFVPIGGWEQDGRLTVHFGPPYRLEATAPPRSKSETRDHAAEDIVMKSIANLLPESLRGEFA